MQKNIVSSVNRAMAGEKEKTKNVPVGDADTGSLNEIKEELQHLKEENALFAAAMEEVKAQNQELRDKIEQIISKKAKAKKKTGSRNKKVQNR